MMSDIASRTLTITRQINAAPAAVYAAWADPAILPGWFGPAGFSCITKEIDLRPGGLWQFDMIGPDGTVYANRHRFRAMQPAQRIDYVMDDGGHAAAPVTCTALFQPRDGGCFLSLSLTFQTADEAEQTRAFGALEFGGQTLAKLAAVVEG